MISSFIVFDKDSKNDQYFRKCGFKWFVWRFLDNDFIDSKILVSSSTFLKEVLAVYTNNLKISDAGKWMKNVKKWKIYLDKISENNKKKSTVLKTSNCFCIFLSKTWDIITIQHLDFNLYFFDHLILNFKPRLWKWWDKYLRLWKVVFIFGRWRLKILIFNQLITKFRQRLWK